MTVTPLSPTKRGKIVGLSTHHTVREISAELGVPRSTVQNIIKKYRETGSTRLTKPSGRPVKFSERTLSFIKREIKSNRWLSALDLAKHFALSNIEISAGTVRNIAKQLGFNRRLAKAKPILNATTIQKRLAWANQYKDFIWDDVIFTDEASVCLEGTARKWVWRRPDEAYDPALINLKLRRGPAIMVWAAIYKGGKSKLLLLDTSQSEGKRRGVTAAIYRDQVTNGPLRDLVTAMRLVGRSPKVLEDNAKVHTAAIARECALEHGFEFIDHPPSSPDLNPIEHCWAWLKHQLATGDRHPTNPTELFSTISAIWDRMPQEMVDHIISTMTERNADVLKARGKYTRW